LILVYHISVVIFIYNYNRMIVDKKLEAIMILFVVLYQDWSTGLRRTVNNFNYDTRSQYKDSNLRLSEYKPEVPHQYTTRST
jgi:hypothetical protein